MANFNITINNQINTFGPAPTNKWNDYNWNAFTWGEGNQDLPVTEIKVIDNDLIFASHMSLTFTIVISNDLGISIDMLSERLYDAAGYLYLYPDNVTEAEDRFTPTYSELSASTTSWTTATGASTTWT